MADHTHPEIEDRLTAEITLLRTELAGLSGRVDVVARDVAVLDGRMRQGFADTARLLQLHGDHLRQQDETLARHGEMLARQGETLAGHGEMLTGHGEMLTGHGEMLRQILGRLDGDT